MDSVAINAHDTKKEVDILIDDAIKYGYKLIFPLACFNEYAIERLKGTGTKVGGGVGSALGVGEEPTAVKLAAAKHWAEAGCGEIEMFMNVPKLRSGMYDEAVSYTHLGDGTCATLGAGATVPGEGYASVGTSTWLCFVTDKLTPDPMG